MIDVVAAEWLKLRTLRSNRYLLAFSLVSVLLCAGVAYLVIRGYDGQTGDDRLRFDSLGAGVGTGLPVAYFVMGALGALSITSEYASGMIHTSLAAVPRRRLLLFAKIPPLAAVTLVAGLLLVFGMHAATAAVLGERAGHVVLDGRTLGGTLADPGVAAELLVAAAAMPLVAMVGLGLGAVLRSTAGSLVTLIVILFVLPLVAQALPMPWRARIGSVMIENLPAQIVGGDGAGVLAPLAALALLIAYPVAALTAGAAAIAVRRRRRGTLVAGGLATALLAGVVVIPPVEAAATVTWKPCGGELECAAVPVPVDWSKPSGRRISIPIARLAHTGAHRRIGTVFAVPGGPGTSGVADLRKRGGGFAQLRGWFDVVSFAPRNTWNLGVLPADCFISGPWITVPEDRAAYRRLAERNRRAAEECRAHDPEFFDHLDSASVARDIEAIRAALGEERLSLLATSYGATSAATYARLFPGRVRALAIDGAAGPVVDREEEARRQYQAIEEQFARFAAWCADTPDCALHGRDVGAVWRELTAAADRSPVPVRGDRVAYSGFDLKTAALPDLQSPGQAPEFVNWGRLARAIDAAVKGDASGFADNIEQITRSRKFPSTRGMNATHCTDGRGFADYAEFRRLKALGERLSPHFADVNLWHALGCVGWPAPVTNPPAPLPGDRLPPLLGVGAWIDHAYSAAMVRGVPGSSTVRFEGHGHGLVLSGNQCVIAHVNQYLTFLRLPPPGTTCRPAPAG